MRTKYLLLALGAASFASTPASAAVNVNFTPGAPSPSTGFTLVNTFNTAGEQAQVTGNANFQFCTGSIGSVCAPPANSVPLGTAYLAVTAGGFADINLGSVSAFQFDYGSIDSFNTFTIFTAGGAPIIVNGGNFPPANGNQVANGTNGLLTVTGNAGELFTGIRFASSGNSMEIDNMAVQAVPEPATWGMMLFGFGAIGFAMRRRKEAKGAKRIRLSYS